MCVACLGALVHELAPPYQPSLCPPPPSIRVSQMAKFRELAHMPRVSGPSGRRTPVVAEAKRIIIADSRAMQHCRSDRPTGDGSLIRRHRGLHRLHWCTLQAVRAGKGRRAAGGGRASARNQSEEGDLRRGGEAHFQQKICDKMGF